MVNQKHNLLMFGGTVLVKESHVADGVKLRSAVVLEFPKLTMLG